MILNNATAVVPMEQDYPRIIPFEVIHGKKKDKEVKYNKDGSVNRSKCNKVDGKTSEVYAFKTKEEIDAMLNVFNKRIEEASNDEQMKIAFRNKLLFVIGINVGIRGSDLRTLKWSFFFNRQDDGRLEFKKFYKIQPLKQRKQNKFVPMYFDEAVKNAINNHISKYPIENLDDFVFKSRKGNEAIEAQYIWKIIKDAAIEAGIEQNIGAHSLRKSFGFWCWHKAEDKNKALVILQQIFNHSSTQTTAKYIGILDDEIEDMFNNLNLGLDMI